jgi:hypothetical protein
MALTTESDRSSTRTAADSGQGSGSADREMKSDQEKVLDGKRAVVDEQSGKVELQEKPQGPYSIPRW